MKHIVWKLSLICTAFLFFMAGCGSKENLPTEEELSAKIAAKQKQEQETKVTAAKQELDQYFAKLTSQVKKLSEDRAALVAAFSGLSEQKYTEAQALEKATAAISAYETSLAQLKKLPVPAYTEVQQFHQDMYRIMSEYTPLMKKAREGLRTKSAPLLQEVDKQMAALDKRAKSLLEKTTRLSIKVE
jgi:cell division protein ZapA (FtsZ GTPase activity inhibitor)